MDNKKFLVDCMLGKLAKWLRILGFDTAYYSDISDAELINSAIIEKRILLTRDRMLARRKDIDSSLLIESETPFEQLKQVLEHFASNGITVKIFSRCLECNTPLKTIEKKQVEGKVPPFVFKTQEHFAYCPRCERIFWRGTHIDNVIKKIAHLNIIIP
jgi:uncharacterized protein with PIN domain